MREIEKELGKIYEKDGKVLVDIDDNDGFVLKGKNINKEASEHWLGDDWDSEYNNIVGDAMILKGDGRME